MMPKDLIPIALLFKGKSDEGVEIDKPEFDNSFDEYLFDDQNYDARTNIRYKDFMKEINRPYHYELG